MNAFISVPVLVVRGDLDRRRASGLRRRDLEQDNGVMSEMSVGEDLCADPLNEHQMAKKKEERWR